MSGPLLAVLATDAWSSDRSVLVGARSGATEVLLSERRRMECIGRIDGGVSLRPVVGVSSMPGLASSPNRTRGRVGWATTGGIAAIDISGFEPSVDGGDGGVLVPPLLPSSVGDCFLFRRRRSQKKTITIKSRTSPPITPPRMAARLGPLDALFGLLLAF